MYFAFTFGLGGPEDEDVLVAWSGFKRVACLRRSVEKKLGDRVLEWSD